MKIDINYMNLDSSSRTTLIKFRKSIFKAEQDYEVFKYICSDLCMSYSFMGSNFYEQDFSNFLHSLKNNCNYLITINWEGITYGRY